MTESKTKTLLVKAPKGFGYHLTGQPEPVYVSNRPFVVEDNGQVRLAVARGGLILLGEAKGTDEKFASQYAKDPSKALDAAIIKTKGQDEVTLDAAKAEATEAAKQKAEIEKSEKERIAREKAAQKKAEAAAKKAKAKVEESKTDETGSDEKTGSDEGSTTDDKTGAAE